MAIKIRFQLWVMYGIALLAGGYPANTQYKQTANCNTFISTTAIRPYPTLANGAGKPYYLSIKDFNKNGVSQKSAIIKSA